MANAQVDVVAVNWRDKAILLGECKWGVDAVRRSVVLNELFSGSLIVTERHNSNHPGYISLNFPDDPVEVGAEWSGEVPWYYEDYYVFDPTELRLPASYKLLSIEQGEKGRFAVIEQRIEADVANDKPVWEYKKVRRIMAKEEAPTIYSVTYSKDEP